VNQSLDRKRHTVVWDGRDDAGVSVSSGVYFYRLEAGSFSTTRKMVVMK
jgi:NAD-dependent SIR2 family protein deacetylase